MRKRAQRLTIQEALISFGIQIRNQKFGWMANAVDVGSIFAHAQTDRELYAMELAGRSSRPREGSGPASNWGNDKKIPN